MTMHNSFFDADQMSLAELRVRIEADHELSVYKRRDIASACRSLAEWFHLPEASIPASAPYIRDRLERVHPTLINVTRRRVQNVRSLILGEAVKAFVTAYQREFNELQKHRFAASNAIKDDLAAAAKKLDGLYDAVADGMRSEGILGRITELEERITQLQATQDKQKEPSPVLMHPNLAAAYQRKLAQLSDMLKEPAFASEAVPLIRDLIERVDLRDTPEGWEVILHGQLAALFNVALSDTKQAHPVTDEPCFVSSTKVVAGAGFEPAAFRL